MSETRARLRIGEAAQYTRFSRKTLGRAVEAGDLHMSRPSGKGGHRYFEVEELDRWLNSIKTAKR